MAENADASAPKQEAAQIRVDGAEGAPVVFFEQIATVGNSDGIVTLMLVIGVTHLSPEGQGKTISGALVSAHLKCSVQAAVNLRNNIDRALLLGAPTEGAAN